MKFKKILSAVVALTMTASMAVMPMSAKAAELYSSYTTSAEDRMLSVNLNDFMVTGETYEFSFNVKPETVDVTNAIRVDLGFQGSVTSPGNYGVFYLYDNGVNALGKSDWNKIGNVAAYKDYVAENGVDMNMVWNTSTGVVDITADFGEKEYNYTYTPGVVAAGGSYGKFLVWSESTTVKVTNLEIKNTREDAPTPTYVFYEKKGDWKISGEHNYLKVNDLGIKADGKYAIEFSVTAPTGNPCFFFDWRDYANNSKSACTSWNYKALAGIYDDGSNDCLALGVATPWVGTIKRGGLTNEYKYRIIWDVAASKFDLTVTYKKTSDGTTGTYTATYTSSNAFRGDDVLKFATNGGTATVTDLTIMDPEYYYMESYKTKGAADACAVPLDNYFVTGNKYELTWNITPDSIADMSIRADIVYGNTANQGNYGFFLLYNGGTDALGMSDYNKIGKVADYTADVLTKGVDFKMIWDTATGKADITVTFPTGKAYTYTYNAGVMAANQKYGSLFLQGPHTAITVNNLEIKRYIEPVVEGKPNPVIEGTSVQEVDMEDYQGKAWDVVIGNFDSEKTYTAEFIDGEDTKTGEINFDNVETSGSVAFAVFLHTSRTAAVLDITAQ